MRLERDARAAHDAGGGGEETTTEQRVAARGIALLQSPLTNKDTAFTEEERIELGLVGLLPPRVETLDEQVLRAHASYLSETSPLGRYRFLRRTQDTNEVLFHALLEQHLAEMLPVVYTPTVGEGVERFSHVYERPRGLSLALGSDPAAAVAAWPHDDVRMIVATDASAILGIGDHGYNGLGISIGKLALYTAAGAVAPQHTLPVVLDVGTDRAVLHRDPTYLGLRRPRARGNEHLDFVRAFVHAVRARWPHAIVQWEDFGKDSAFAVLDEFRGTLPSFNDDIQGTGAVALAGLLATGERLSTRRFLVFGAGAGGVGVARAIRSGLEREGLSRAEAQAHLFVVDSKGLLVEGRAMEPYKRELAQPAARVAGWKTAGPTPSLLDTIANAKITALLGLSGQAGAFDERIIREVHAVAGANGPKPIVFALSNPTSASEARPADVLAWTNGDAIVATGSPFDPVVLAGIPSPRAIPIGQGNNAFVFPGLGFGALLARASEITTGMVEECAYALADFTLSQATPTAPSLVYPPISSLRAATLAVAARVARRAVIDGVARATLPTDAVALSALVARAAWRPKYVPFRLG